MKIIGWARTMCAECAVFNALELRFKKAPIPYVYLVHPRVASKSKGVIIIYGMGVKKNFE